MSLLATQRVFATSMVLILAHLSAAAVDICTFEKSICPGWVSTNCSKEACFQARKVSSMQHGPTYDHTSKNADGWCAYATLATPSIKHANAELTRRVKGPFCFTGWYHLSGVRASSAAFSVVQVNSTWRTYFHFARMDRAGRWQRVRYSEKRSGVFKLTVDYRAAIPYERGAFAVDDFRLDDKACPAEPKDGSCDFDWGDSCGYDLGNDRNGKWMLEDKNSTGFVGADYSTNTESGGLAVLVLKGNNTKAVMTSPTLRGRGGNQCLKFHYFLAPSIWNMRTEYHLRVSVEGSQRTSRTWYAGQLLRGSWTAAEVSFKQEKDFTVKIECAMRGSTVSKSYCAIDAIKLRNCQGNRALNDSLCDFEDGWCTWESIWKSYYRNSWLLGGGNVKTTLARPLKDHTYGNATGSYVYFSNYEKEKGDEGELISEILSDSSNITQCAEFWYIVSGDKTTELKVFTNASEKGARDLGIHLWTQKGGASSEWQLGRVAVPHRTRVSFRATVGPAATPAFVALDDIAIVHHDRCETFPKGSEALSATELISCDFLSWDSCKWTSASSRSSKPMWVSGLDWMASRIWMWLLGPVSSPDVVQGDTVCMTAPSLAQAGGTAMLQSPFVGPQSEPACFTFWYHMFGGRGASLQLNLEKSADKGSVKNSVLLFSQRDRTTADRWYNVRRTVNLDSIHNKMVFTIKNTTSIRRGLVVALGPLALTMGECDVLTDGRGYCDFEYDTCGWTAAAAWSRQMVITSVVGLDAFSGPLNSLFSMKATPHNASADGALLTSPVWSGQKEPQCLEFWYEYGGRKDPTLQVEVKVNGKSEVVWQQPSYRGKSWMFARAEISQNKAFQVVFRAKFGEDYTQYVHLDDVVLRPEPCLHPAECSFNDGLCGYVNQLQGNFRWLVGTGRYERPGLQPAVPRAKDSPPFAYLDLTINPSDAAGHIISRRQGPPDTVGIRSPLFDVTNDDTHVTIRYYRRGPDITMANLSVTCYGKSSDKVQPSVQSNVQMAEASQWMALNVAVKQGNACQLAVTASRGQGTNGTMAIASVKVTSSKPAAKKEGTKDSPTRCTFEDGTMCGWNTEGLSKQWSLNDPANQLPAFPRFDHTMKAYRGRFVYATHDVDYDFGTAVFKSPDLDVNATEGACLSFWLFTVHSSHVSLDVWSGIDRLYTASARSGHQWEHVVVNFKRPEGKFKLWISFFMKQALVALDDIEVRSGSCEQRDFCSWEIGPLCPLYHAPGRFGTWTVRSGSETGLPDHTLKNLTGNYLYLNTTAVYSHHPISRVSMRSRPPTEATCVTFWFSGRGALGELNVYRFTKETVLRDPLVSVYTPMKSGLWIARRVRISSRNRWSLVFEGVATEGARTDSAIMIDDIEFTDGECPPYEYCTFEDECLPWEVIGDGKNGAAFEVERAGSFDKLPRDHTTQTEDGYYLLFKSTGTKGNKTSFALLEPELYKCVSFWYFLPKSPNSVRLFAKDELILKGQGVWKRYQWQDPLFPGDDISAETVTTGDGFVAIDDVLISEDCSQKTRSTERFDCGKQSITIERVCDFVVDCANGDDERNCGECDFSDGLCGWRADGVLNSGASAWRRQKIGEVENSPTTGVDGTSNGYYLLFHSDVTGPNRGSVRAVIDSPVIRNTNKLCTITFWFNYISNGTAIDIDLVMKMGAYAMPVWTLSALSETPEEGVWNEAEIEIGRYKSEISFYFNAIHTRPETSMFAVDNIEYTDCALPAKQDKCADGQFRCTNGACVMKFERCDYVDDCGDNSDEEDCGDHRLSCNFDTSFCDWLPQAPADKSKEPWRLWRPSPFLLQSPSRDHTTGTPEGQFMMVRSTTTVNATVVGPTIDNSTLCAITFFYTMQGMSQPKLTLAHRTTADGPWETLWKQQKPSEFFHFVAESVIFPGVAPYQVAFIGEHAMPDKLGYIAIDDIHFWDSCTTKTGGLPMAPVPTTPAFTCGENKFQCTGTKQCIPLSKVCDFKEDCSNGADESRCGSCEFTTDLCGLENEDSGARFGWNWTSVEDGKKKQGFPNTDSRSNMQGAYAAYSLMNPEVPRGHMTGMATPPLGEIAHSCEVTFYAYLPDKPTAFLMFGVRPRPRFGAEKSSLRILGTVSVTSLRAQWRKMLLKVGRWDAGARFVYVANTLGVSIDRPEYNLCRPDSTSDAQEAVEKINCNFSNPSNCGWFPERKAAGTTWTLYSGGAVPGSKWQPTDSASHKGAYMYAQNLHSVVSKASLVSVKISPTPETGRCFTFWYNMWHPNVGHLNLLMRESNVSTSLLWTRSAPQGKEWKQGQVQLYSDDFHQLIFEAVLLSGKHGIIAIDNFVLEDTSCGSDKTGGCNFESDSCGWELHNWEHTSASESNKPSADHTTESPTGRFTMAKSPGGRMVSPQSWYNGTQPRCFRFWFYLTGTRADSLSVNRVFNEGREEAVLWYETPYEDGTKLWRQGSVNLPAYPATPTIVFDATVSDSEGSVIAVDDISLGNVPCPSPGSCSFEEDMCGWSSNKILQSALWYRNRGATVSNTTGVQKDHTLGSSEGYYVLLDAADLAGHPFGSLQSEILRLGPSVCFSLYYCMKKDSGASLTVAFFGRGGAIAGLPHTVESTKPRGWTRLSIERSDLPGVFSIIITGRTAQGRSDVMIDDIDVRRGRCQESAITTKGPAPATKTSVRPTIPAIPPRVSTQKTSSTATKTSVRPTTPAMPPPVSTQGTPSTATKTSVRPTTPAIPPRVSTQGTPSTATKASVRPTTPAIPPRVSTQGTPLTELPTVSTEVVTPEPVSSETPVSVSGETPVSPEPRPALVCGRGEFSCRDDSTCIPAALLCDGVNDCPNGLDEKCGSAKRCKEDEFLCPTGSPSTCMPRSLLCDGREDCVSGSDESLCRACPHYLCKNGGICGWTPKAPSPTCDCRDGYEGRRCNLLASVVRDAGKLTSKESSSTAGVVAGIIVVLAVLLIVGVAGFVAIRRRRMAQNSAVFIDNPSYDASADETKIN